MKLLLVPVLLVTFGVVLLPVVLAGGDAPALSACGTTDAQMNSILETIRTLESGGNYAAQSNGSTASGAYQFLDSTWSNFGGFARASEAPPSVQDSKAAEHVAEILAANAGDVASVPVVWYIGRVPPADSVVWDRVPAPQAGNRLTPREYQSRWMARYEQVTTSATASSSPSDSRVPMPGGCRGVDIDPLPGGWSLPGPRAMIEADPRVLNQPHHDYPAWDWMIPQNTPIYAVRGGTVAAIRTWPHNWWDQGCPNSTRDCDTCGVGLTIRDVDGNRWAYCHGTTLTVALGSEVTAGQQIMWSGNTGRSGGPHLHLQIKNAAGILVCPQRLLRQLFAGTVEPNPSNLTTSGCTF